MYAHSSEFNPDLHFSNLFFFSAGNAAVSEADIRKPNSDMLLMDAAGVPRTNQGKNRSTVINCDQQIN